MSGLMLVLGGLLLLVSMGCTLIVLIDAFKNEIWKGVLFLLCGLYGLYYMFAEYESDKKGLVLLGALGGSIAGYALLFAGGAMAVR